MENELDTIETETQPELQTPISPAWLRDVIKPKWEKSETKPGFDTKTRIGKTVQERLNTRIQQALEEGHIVIFAHRDLHILDPKTERYIRVTNLSQTLKTGLAEVHTGKPQADISFQDELPFSSFRIDCGSKSFVVDFTTSEQPELAIIKFDGSKKPTGLKLIAKSKYGAGIRVAKAA